MKQSKTFRFLKGFQAIERRSMVFLSKMGSLRTLAISESKTDFAQRIPKIIQHINLKLGTDNPFEIVLQKRKIWSFLFLETLV